MSEANTAAQAQNVTVELGGTPVRLRLAGDVVVVVTVAGVSVSVSVPATRELPEAPRTFPYEPPANGQVQAGDRPRQVDPRDESVAQVDRLTAFLEAHGPAKVEEIMAGTGLSKMQVRSAICNARRQIEVAMTEGRRKFWKIAD